MPRVIRERSIREAVLYDTRVIERNTVTRFFSEKAKVGFMESTNLQTKNEIDNERSFRIANIGIRLIGKSWDEEYQLLDHLYVSLCIGSIPLLHFAGPFANMYKPPNFGHRLAMQVTVKAKEPLIVQVDTFKGLPESVVARVYLSGLIYGDQE